jgi:hypothetical protein
VRPAGLWVPAMVLGVTDGVPDFFLGVDAVRHVVMIQQ